MKAVYQNRIVRCEQLTPDNHDNMVHLIRSVGGDVANVYGDDGQWQVTLNSEHHYEIWYGVLNDWLIVDTDNKPRVISPTMFELKYVLLPDFSEVEKALETWSAVWDRLGELEALLLKGERKADQEYCDAVQHNMTVYGYATLNLRAAYRKYKEKQ
jgi:hypothetical protein